MTSVNANFDASMPATPPEATVDVTAVAPMGMDNADDADAGIGAVTFTEIYEDVFRRFCSADFCHGGGAAGFDVSSRAAAFESLVEQPANPERECAELGLLRVQPGDPESSLLYLKLRVGGVPCGQQMPVGGELRPELRTAIEAWIAAGAKND